MPTPSGSGWAVRAWGRAGRASGPGPGEVRPRHGARGPARAGGGRRAALRRPVPPRSAGRLLRRRRRGRASRRWAGYRRGRAQRAELSFSERRHKALELAAGVDRSVHPPFLLSEPLTRISEGACGSPAPAPRWSSAMTSDRSTSPPAPVSPTRRWGGPGRGTDHVRAAQQDGREFSSGSGDARVGDPAAPGARLRGGRGADARGHRPGPVRRRPRAAGRLRPPLLLVLDHAVLCRSASTPCSPPTATGSRATSTTA